MVIKDIVETIKLVFDIKSWLWVTEVKISHTDTALFIIIII
jgi:hypothetical protein